ncbi:ion channel [Thalassotalea eurytherma]|uniref:Potassium channel domain-containing protein n=1 Tax=Thalassotalea eurytherma TaxID=1144278 RepID=A0ABQ6H0L8_9GAMM|nr:ion channel [Thalassotalea eurytherma]GLX81142.1 hypothetical protein theurythT_05940 [Thalassotalea eurytherma]
MSEDQYKCQYIDPENHLCPNEATDDGLCFWHSLNVDKSGSNIKDKLEHYAQHGGFLRGLKLQHCELNDIDLVNHGHKTGYDLSYCDFYRASLRDAHLFNANLNNASLMKTDLRDANLNCTSLLNANLLGIKLSGCKIENIDFGKNIFQEELAKLATEKKHHSSAHDYYVQSEEIYRDLRKHSESEGLFNYAGTFIKKELTMRRMQQPNYSAKRIVSKGIDLFCGYGEEPMRIVGFSILLILICAILYSVTGLNYHGNFYIFDINASFKDNINWFFSCLYYSVVTFTTLGYGDFTPIGVSRAIAAFEAFTGSFTIALFVVVFVKKMTR